MNSQHEKDTSFPGGCWAEEDAAPRGIIMTKEQYDYVKYYSDNTSISFNLGEYETCIGKYVSIGDYFGGAAFYFYATDNFDFLKRYPDVYGSDWSFSYGKYGEIIF